MLLYIVWVGDTIGQSELNTESDILMNLFLFYEEKETWRIFQDMFKIVQEPKEGCTGS